MHDIDSVLKLAKKVDVLAVAAHRDDIEMAIGGTVLKLIAQGYKVGILDLTEGEMGTRGTVEERTHEAKCGAEMLGVACRLNLGLPDGNIQVNDESLDGVIRVVRETRPSLVLAPYWSDRHPDHAATGNLVYEASFKAGFAKWDTRQPHHRPLRVFYYMCHHRFEPSFVVDISDHWETKRQAILCHKSQIITPESSPDEPSTYVSSPQFWQHLETQDRQYGEMIATEFGEPFITREMVRVDDLVAQAGASVERYGS